MFISKDWDSLWDMVRTGQRDWRTAVIVFVLMATTMTGREMEMEMGEG